MSARGFPWSAPDWPQGVERPLPRRSLGVDYDTAWSRRYPARLARALVLELLTRPLVAAVASPTVSGLDHLERLQRPVIFAANHESHVDTPVVLACLPERFRHRTIVAAGADYFFDRTWKAALWAGLLAAIPVDRQKVNRRSSDLARELIGQGWSLVIFPEGGRSPDGWGQPFRGGAAYLSVRTGAPVVPLYLGGTRRIQARGERGLRRASTRVRFGPALRPADGEDTRRFGTRVAKAVAVLADEETTDWWSAQRRAAQGTTPELTGPGAAPWRRSWAMGARGERAAQAWPPR
ncbi:MAG: lysophospholipid acyltransferase family protein [Acidimicrobiales bacterium]